MFKAAKAGPRKAITANRLNDGRVVFVDDNDGWTLDIAEARIFEDGQPLEAGLAFAKAEEAGRIVVEPYPIDVAVGDDGVPVPVRFRERIRAERGPTIVYGDAERAKLATAGVAGKV
jgi:sulfite reductase (NADPH) hemoprotein beta-component